MRKILFALLGLLVLIVLLFLIAVARLDSEAISAKALRQIHRKTGIELQAAKMALHPLKGLALDGVTAKATAPAGTVNATVEYLRIRHRLLPLLWGQVVMDEVLLRRPVIELISKPAKRTRRDKREARERRKRGEGQGAETEQSAMMADVGPDVERGLRISITHLEIEDGAFYARTVASDAPDLSLENLAMILQGLEFDPNAQSSTTAVSGRGSFSTGRVVQEDFMAIESSGDLRVTGGVARVEELVVRSENADLVVEELEIRLDQDPPRYALKAAGDLDLNGTLGVGQGGRFGPVEISLTAEGRGPELAAMVGEGTLTLHAGSLPGFPAMVQIEDLLGRSLLTGRQYETTPIAFELFDSQLLIAPFELIGEGGRVGGEGEVDIGGIMDFDLYVSLPGETWESGVVDFEQLRSLEDDQGMIRIPFSLRGTYEDPKVGMEWDGMRDLVRGAGRSWAEDALESAADKVREWLREQSKEADDPQ
jgi:hypothetical protein